MPAADSAALAIPNRDRKGVGLGGQSTWSFNSQIAASPTLQRHNPIAQIQNVNRICNSSRRLLAFSEKIAFPEPAG